MVSLHVSGVPTVRSLLHICEEMSNNSGDVWHQFHVGVCFMWKHTIWIQINVSLPADFEPCFCDCFAVTRCAAPFTATYPPSLTWNLATSTRSGHVLQTGQVAAYTAGLPSTCRSTTDLIGQIRHLYPTELRAVPER